MYAILGDYEGAGRGFAEPMSAFVVCLGMYKRRSLLHTGVFETQMPFGMSYLRRGGFKVCFVLCTICLQQFTWPPSLAFLLLQFSINISTVFLLANVELLIQ